VPICPFQRSFGTLAVTRTVHVSHSSKILTSICASLQTRAHIRLSFSYTHFKILAEHLTPMTLSMFSSIGPAVCFLKSVRSRFLLSDVFPDRSGVLEGEQLVKSPSIRGDLWYCEQPVVYYDAKSHSQLNQSCLRPIVTTPPADPSSEGTFEDWTVLSHPASHTINIHLYGPRGSPGSTGTLVCFTPSYSDLIQTSA
jgi:hypothetical protein